ARTRATARPTPVPPRLAGLLLQKGEPGQQVMHARARPLHALAQRPVLLLEIRHAPARLGVGLRGPPPPPPPPPPPRPPFFPPPFRFRATRAPAGQPPRRSSVPRPQPRHTPPGNPLPPARDGRPP